MDKPQKENPPAHKPQEVKLSRSTIIIGGVIVAAALVLLVVYATWRHFHVKHELEESAKAAAQINVEYIPVKRDGKPHELLLPGDIQAYATATLYARTNGYVKAWHKDIGDQVKAGELVAEIDAPDLDAQLGQSVAGLGQAKANLEIAQLSYMRQKDLFAKKVISQQEFDQSRTSLEGQDASVKASEANVRNLQAQQGFEKISAPFDGIVTKRFVDLGTLVSLGGGSGTMLFSIAQSDPLRIFVYVPQTNAQSIHDGMKAKVIVQDYQGRDFEGTVARTAGAIDPTSRTLLTEVDIPNHDGALYAGMYGQVKFVIEEKSPPILIPANAFMFRTDGPQVAVVQDGDTIHWQAVKIGRDFGTTLELLSGLEENTRVVINPTDDLREGMKVQAKQQEEKPPEKPAGK